VELEIFSHNLFCNISRAPSTVANAPIDVYPNRHLRNAGYAIFSNRELRPFSRFTKSLNHNREASNKVSA